MILQVWNRLCTRTARSTILPDGGRDVLITRRPGAPPQVTLSALQTVPEAPLLTQGSRLTGYRLAPGQRVARLDLLAGPAAQDDPRALIDELTVSCAAVDEALACLAQAPSVHVATRDLGVNAATLLRVLRRAGLPPPRFWLQLAQVRRAARGLIRPGAGLVPVWPIWPPPRATPIRRI